MVQGASRWRVQDERFARNSAWLQAHATEIYTQYRGKCICVAGEGLFVADTPEEVLAQPHSSPTAPPAVTDETAKT